MSNISLYADDATIVTIKDKNTLESILKILENFASISGLKVNAVKTQILPTGKNNDNYDDLTDYNTCKEISILGIELGCDTTTLFKNNFEPIVKKINACLNMWKQRYLS